MKNIYIILIALFAMSAFISCDSGSASPSQALDDTRGGDILDDENLVIITIEDGTEEHPFLVESADDLASIGGDSGLPGYENWSNCSCYILTRDIDLSASDYAEWTPIKYFSGSFDGKGHTISNMVISRSNGDNERYGLFGYIIGGRVKNLSISGSITLSDESDRYIGGLAGEINSFFSSDIAITNCHSAVDLSTHGDMVGGLAGYCLKEASGHSITITSCSATGTVICGKRNTNGENSQGKGGGLIGCADGVTVRKSSACGTVKLRMGSSFAGGLAGYVQGESSFENCYAQGDVSSVDNTDVYKLGGFIGGVQGGRVSITNSYASGSLSYGCDDDLDENEDGFFSGGSARTVNCFAMEATPRSGVSVLSETECNAKSTFTDGGWDFDLIWVIDEGREYPCLQ